MTPKKTIKTTGGLSLLVWLVIGQMLFLGKGVQAGDNGQLPEFNTTQPYLIYYGNWTAGHVDYARTNYHLVILHPVSNITSNQIATIERGKDNIAGTTEDVMVVAYLSAGEDDRNGATVAGDRMGPHMDHHASDSDPLSGITNIALHDGRAPATAPGNIASSANLTGSIKVGFYDGHVESTKLAVLWTLEWHNGWAQPATIPNPPWHFLTASFIGHPMAVKQAAQMVIN